MMPEWRTISNLEEEAEVEEDEAEEEDEEVE
jgi:hypothetical protein